MNVNAGKLASLCFEIQSLCHSHFNHTHSSRHILSNLIVISFTLTTHIYLVPNLILCGCNLGKMVTSSLPPFPSTAPPPPQTIITWGEDRTRASLYQPTIQPTTLNQVRIFSLLAYSIDLFCFTFTIYAVFICIFMLPKIDPHII